ncbi:unnamed protein product [Phaeothamnion confervicola]
MVVLNQALIGVRELILRYPQSSHAIELATWGVITLASDTVMTVAEWGLGKLKLAPKRRPNIVSEGFYVDLQKPSWTPPNWAFPTIWIPLKCLQAVGAFAVWGAVGRRISVPSVQSFLVFIMLGDLWQNTFFRRHHVGAGMSVMVAFYASLFVAMERFWRVRPVAALLLAPTAAWVAVATALNYRIWRLNGSEPLYPTTKP